MHHPSRLSFQDPAWTWTLRSMAVAFGIAVLLAVIPGASRGLFIPLNDALVFPNSEAFWSGITLYADTWLTLALILPVVLLKPRIAPLLFYAALLATLMTHSLKPLLDMPRPPAVLDSEQFHLIGSSISSKSFPSGHTVSAFVFAGLMIMAFARRPVVLVLSLVFAALMGLSRIAVGIHWPVDVAAGAFIGLLAVLLADALIKKYPKIARGRGWQPVAVVITAACGLSAPWASLGYPQGSWAAISVFILAVVCIFILLFWYFSRTKLNQDGQHP